MTKKTSEVFGISNTILSDSYVDRGSLDDRIRTLIERPTHIALRGESKCGKSWLRQKTVPNAITVQCRLGKTVQDVYIDALSQLEIKLTIESGNSNTLRASIEASGTFGAGLLAKLGFKGTVSGDSTTGDRQKPVGHDMSDLRFIADILNASDRRLVIEDFHYMTTKNRKEFAFDLKALWDFGCFVIIIGVWSQSNMLIFLNPDLTGRIEEISIYWSKDDLVRVLSKGGSDLPLSFSST